jgi:hypothetical protein
MVIASLLIACGASEELAAETAAPTATLEPPTATPEPPTATPEPPTATPLPTESQVPTTASQVPRISVEELKERLDDGQDIVIVDSRWKDPYDLEHIAGAILPAESPLDELPRNQEIVIYCT